MHSNENGALIIIGGAEDKEGDQTILREFVKMAGGDHAHIVIMTVATQLPLEVGEEYLRVFRKLAGEKAQISALHISDRDQANLAENVERIEVATGIFFTGGDQFRITRILGGTKVDTCLHDRHEQGLILAGTSAGASMMSSTMIINGPAETTAKIGMTQVGAGMEFLPGVIIDQHFAQRGRINRLLAAIAQNPHHLGIGIDENTALIVEGRMCRIIGEGSITIVDAGSVGEYSWSKEAVSDNLTICDVRLHLLPAGNAFDLRSRTPFLNINNSNSQRLS